MQVNIWSIVGLIWIFWALASPHVRHFYRSSSNHDRNYLVRLFRNAPSDVNNFQSDVSFAITLIMVRPSVNTILVPAFLLILKNNSRRFPYDYLLNFSPNKRSVIFLSVIQRFKICSRSEHQQVEISVGNSVLLVVFTHRSKPQPHFCCDIDKTTKNIRNTSIYSNTL